MGKGVGRIVFLAALVAIAGFFGWREWKARRASALPAGIVSGNGRIESVQVDVATKYGGRVANLLVKEGDLVQPGEVVAHIDTAEVEAQLASGTAEGEPLVKQDLLAMPLREAREHFERAYLQQQLLLCGGKVGQLAKRVGMERTHLYRKLRSLGVDFRQSLTDD